MAPEIQRSVMGIGFAMWSGPRNISTAMMRSWGNRSDTRVIDEPFYAHYLAHTGIDHPMANQVIEHGETNWQRIVEQLVDIPPNGVVYQKHITTHWLDHYSSHWLSALSHAFLIRDPRHVVASYANKRHQLTVADLGYARQLELFELVTCKTGTTPLVVDSQRFLDAPEHQLRQLCERLGLAFEHSMLSWETGARATDGVWGQHWYDAVNRSTGFAAPRQNFPDLGPELQAIVDECLPHYQSMLAHAIK